MKGTGFHLRTVTVLKKILCVLGEASPKVYVITGEVGRDKMVDPT